MASTRRLAALAMAGLALAAAGCGSTQAGAGTGASGVAAAASARGQVDSALRSLYQQRLYGARIGYASSLDGGYEPCPQARTEIHFVGGTDVYPLHPGLSAGAYAQAVAGALKSAGWQVRQRKSPVQTSGPVPYYAITKGSLIGDMYVVPAPPGGSRAVLGVSSGCFTPGPHQTYTVRFYHVPLPHPAATG